MTDALWPRPLGPDAYHGVAGAFVEDTAERTEASSEALLTMFLVAFGVAAGRHRFVRVEASKHYANEFLVIVGASSKARKGLAWDHVSRMIGAADPDFINERTVSGLSSGEGLIAQVADTEDEQFGPPHDRRLLVIQGEYAQALRVAARETNILSMVMRDAWDCKRLQTLVKNEPMSASSGFIGLIGHITKPELCERLSRTELLNGFANRNLFIAVERARLLPFGGRLEGEKFASIQAEIASALAAATGDAEVTFEPDAAALWEASYAKLSEPVPGLLGAAIARAEAHVLRLALIYALLDSESVIREPHLLAALEIWRYAEDSARWVFGTSETGDPLADEILHLFEGRESFTRKELSDHFQRNKSKPELDKALDALTSGGQLRVEKTQQGRGRPTTRYLADPLVNGSPADRNE